MPLEIYQKAKNNIINETDLDANFVDGFDFRSTNDQLGLASFGDLKFPVPNKNSFSFDSLYYEIKKLDTELIKLIQFKI